LREEDLGGGGDCCEHPAERDNEQGAIGLRPAGEKPANCAETPKGRTCKRGTSGGRGKAWKRTAAHIYNLPSRPLLLETFSRRRV